MMYILTKNNSIFHSFLQFHFYYVFYQLASHEKCFSRHEFMVFSVGLVIKNPSAYAEDVGSIPGSGVPMERKQESTPVFLLGESHGQRSLLCYSPCSHKRVRPNLRNQQEQATFSSNHSESIFPSGSNNLDLLLRACDWVELIAIQVVEKANYLILTEDDITLS